MSSSNNSNSQPTNDSNPTVNGPQKAAKKRKNPPTPPSANGKEAKQSLPRVSYQLHQIEGTPYINDSATAAMLIRAYFTPEVWVQQHLFLELTDNWGKLLCIRRIGVGDFNSCIADVRLIIDMALCVGASGVTLGLTRPTGMLDAGLLVEKFITKFDDMLFILGIQLEHFFILGKHEEVDALEQMGNFRGNRQAENLRILM